MTLSGDQWASFNRAILSLYAPFGMDELPDRFLRAVRFVLPGDLTHISLTQPGLGAVDAFLDQPAHQALADLAAHRDDLLDMPGFKDGSFYRGADRGPVSYLDFMGRKRLEATALWEFLCRPLDLSWDLSVNFHRAGEVFFTISTSRSRRRHDAAERALLAMLQPHLRQRFLLAAMAEPDHPLLHTTPAGQGGPAGHIVCDRDGRLLFAPETTLEGLRRAGIRHGQLLPDEWLRWIRNGPADRDHPGVGTGLRLRGATGDAHLHHLGDSATGEHHLLVRLPAEAPGSLTAREQEVALWLTRGKTNREIAAILAVSPSTVKHHVASILDKLMVENRTTAAIRLRSMFG
ncbi:hypothetical protein STVA_12410 [Allostella vacuolata]|nr:hypothetical protein STVA_12410 [Stella vacuolata]